MIKNLEKILADNQIKDIFKTIDISTVTFNEIEKLYKSNAYIKYKNKFVYNNVNSIISNIEKTYNKPCLLIYFNCAFIEFIKKYLFDVCKYSPETINLYIQHILEVLKWVKQNTVFNTDFENVKLIKTYKDKFVLSKKSLLYIHNYPIGLSPYISKRMLKNLVKIRDTFILQAGLGLHYNELRTINKNIFINDYVLKYTVSRSNIEKVIDIRVNSFSYNAILHILQKYDYKCPYTSDPSAYNKYLKNLIAAISFNKELNQQIGINNQRIVKTIYLNDYITSVMAKETFNYYNYTYVNDKLSALKATGLRRIYDLKSLVCNAIEI